MSDAAPPPAARLRTALAAWYREAVPPRGAVAAMLPKAGGGLVSALAAVNVLLGLAPVAFVVATSTVIGRVPAAVSGGPASWRLLLPAFVIAAIAGAVQTVLAPVQLSLGELVQRRVDEQILDAVIGVSLRTPGIAPLEDPETLDTLRKATRQLGAAWLTPGQGCAGLLALVARYVRLGGLVAVVGWAASWWAAVVLLATVLVFRRGHVSGHRRYSRVWRRLVAAERRSEYLRDLAVRPGAGKEIRIFGLVDFLADRYEQSYRGWLAGIWRERRRIYL